ncbi:MAG: hypothetical protein QM811_10165 [Pirellulales bacterium]
MAGVEKKQPELLPDAIKIITSNAACVKCHLIGDYSPGGDPKALGPQLANVHERLRPEYVQGWVANPQFYLPYTAMLKVIQFDKPSDAVKAPGDTPGEQAEYQLRTVVDYLMNYDAIIQKDFKFSKLVPPPPAGAARHRHDARGSGSRRRNSGIQLAHPDKSLQETHHASQHHRRDRRRITGRFDRDRFRRRMGFDQRQVRRNR